uniref:Peptidase M28 domain-containing protein n=1 Tax=Arcella intermedia TaxID=1963864 RepID=A0A6B2L3T2_9EUKA
MVHLNSFNDIALTNGSRAVMTGYVYSAQYVMETLKQHTNCDISTEEFETAIYTELSPPSLSLVEPWGMDFQLGVDYSGLRYGGNGTHHLTNRSLCIIPNGGCNQTDFPPDPNGCIALIQLLPSNDCPLINKAINAEQAKAAAVIFYNHINRTALITSRVRGAGWFPGEPLLTIPALAASYSLGSTLSALSSARVDLQANTKIQIVSSFNVFCETKEGNASNLIVAGAHLDSVPEGPGINDNGSGSASLLEIVVQWYGLGLVPVNRIRFAWWGSEEVGLIGSRNYVRGLTPGELGNIAMNLNFDMLGSPNYYIGVHDGSTAVKAQQGSSVITTMFEEYFNYSEVNYILIDLIAGSDFLPFIEADIPAGGLAAGAGSIKGVEDRALFGGFANAAYDPCYHQFCDTIDNINTEALGSMASAAAYVIQKASQTADLRAFLQAPLTVHPHQTQSSCEIE